MIRVMKYFWFHFVMWVTAFLPDNTPFLRFRGFLVKCAFKKCGRNFQLASGTKILFSSNIELGNDVFIANYCWINAAAGLIVEDEVMLGPFVVVITGDHSFKDGSARFGKAIRGPILLQRGCWIAAHSVITRGVTVGAGALVAANAVVTKNVPSGRVWGGVPAHEISDHTKEVP